MSEFTQMDLLSLLGGPQSKTEKFVEFHQANGHVYDTLVRLGREWVRRTGRRRVGISALFERCRWEIMMTTSDPDFKINNNFKPFYARLIMAQEADLADLFELRRSEADKMDLAA